MSEATKGFPAISDASARVLILGSLPGVRSIQRQEYYAHPRNFFWRIMGALGGFSPQSSYAERTAALNKQGIALWDVCASAQRIGSLDSAIKEEAANDFETFFAKHPSLTLLCFNGRKAAALYQRAVLPELPKFMQLLPTKVLPSTSPAYAGIAYEEKLQQWSSLLPFCGLDQ